MTTKTFPFNDPSKYAFETEWSRMAKEWLGNGVIGNVGQTQCQPFGDNSGASPKIRAGMCAIQGFYFWSDADVVYPAVTQNPGTNKRIDRMVLELNILTKQIAPKVIAGVAAASPVPPALVQQAPTGNGIWQQPIGYIDVPAGFATTGNPVQGVSSTMVRDDREHADTRVELFHSTRRPSASGLIRVAIETDTGNLLVARNNTWNTIVQQRYFGRTTATGTTADSGSTGRYESTLPSLSFNAKAGVEYEINAWGHFYGSVKGSVCDIAVGAGTSAEPEFWAFGRYPVVYVDTLHAFHFHRVRPITAGAHVVRMWLRRLSSPDANTGVVRLAGFSTQTFGFSIREVDPT